MNSSTALCTALLLFVSASAGAECITDRYGKTVCGNGACAIDVYGVVFCAEAGGGAVTDRFGKVYCGAGACALDSLGKVWCSKEPGGGAAVDPYGIVKCLGGCEAGSPALCREGR